ncbi:DNA ligase-1 [Granulicella aggregans]|uniref:DNA ligase n=1 Tax=Granulicella aggregans TaxID=474949 RepID=A0A7W7ZBY4_9BACT|nr:ATP-dependent DNA ligase [Granulicella aggregans]MBB5057066.1 DNA ligase-1 [Granulicella aggregans]
MALFADVASLAEYLSGEPSRLKKRAAIAAALRSAHSAAPASNDAGLLALYIAGTPFAESDPRKLNAGGALLSSAIKAITGATDAALTTAYRRHGDMGAAAFDLWPLQATVTLTLSEVATTFAAMPFAKTTAVRGELVQRLLRRSSPLEAKYLLKLMLGDMRIGVKQSLVEEAIAAAASVEDGTQVLVKAVRHAVMLEADLSRATAMAFSGTLDQAMMRLFHPLGFMLASPVESPEEAVARFSSKPIDEAEEVRVEAFLEDKYDGMRAQIHCGESSRVAMYSRNKEEITESFPDLLEAFASVPASTGGLILDGEILGWDFATGRALPFAVMGQRIGRKRVQAELLRKIPAVFMVFDLLYSAGELQLDKPLKARRNALEAIVEQLGTLATSPIPIEDRTPPAQADLFSQLEPTAAEEEKFARLMLSPSRLVESAEEIDRAYAAARARANEGVMLKAANSHYQPGRRGLAWIKLKRELATLDVVITGAEFGHGRRAGILSDYTFAVCGPAFHQTGELLNVGKAYSGLTDAEIAELSAWAMAHTLEDQGHFRTVEPIRILEVAFNNIMRSERHASGFAMRFPRILRIRDDKPLEEIDTLDRVEEIYQSQVDKPVE